MQCSASSNAYLSIILICTVPVVLQGPSIQPSLFFNGSSDEEPRKAFEWLLLLHKVTNPNF